MVNRKYRRKLNKTEQNPSKNLAFVLTICIWMSDDFAKVMLIDWLQTVPGHWFVSMSLKVRLN